MVDTGCDDSKGERLIAAGDLPVDIAGYPPSCSIIRGNNFPATCYLDNDPMHGRPKFR